MSDDDSGGGKYTETIEPYSMNMNESVSASISDSAGVVGVIARCFWIRWLVQRAWGGDERLYQVEYDKKTKHNHTYTHASTGGSKESTPESPTRIGAGCRHGCPTLPPGLPVA